MTVAAEYLIPLSDARCTDPSVAGAKAAGLARLAARGFDVPDGVVLTTAAFPGGVDLRVLPDVVERVIIAAAARFDGVTLAVRSSSTVEDTAEQSFAGQYESVVGVRGAEALVAAVLRVWRSATSARVTAYRSADHGEMPRPGPMAVLIQRQVLPDAAGVAFTADPVSGDRDRTVVEAVPGLGDRMASGEATPERWVIGPDGVPQRAGSAGMGPVLGPEGAGNVARVARRIAASAGTPQDVEWAVEGERVWLLQARPITTLPDPALEHRVGTSVDGSVEQVPVPVEVPAGRWEREASHAPRPHSPLNRFVFPARSRAAQVSFAEMGALPESIDFAEIGGWEYIRMVPPGGKDRPPPPAWLVPVVMRAVPSLRARARQARVALRAMRSGEWVDRWYEDWRPELQSTIVRLRDTDLTELTDAGLEAHIEDLEALAGRSVEVHMRMVPVWTGPISELAAACSRWLEWDDNRVCDLLSGLSTTSTEPARALAELARLAADHAGLRSLIEQAGPDSVARLPEVSSTFATAFDDYRHVYGCRGLRYDVCEPTLGEQPELLLSLLRDQLAGGFDPAAVSGETGALRALAESEAEAALAELPRRHRARFARLLRTAQRAHPLREDNEWYTVSAPIALVRYGALEVGRRLADRGQITTTDDVFLLELHEARTALASGSDQRPLVICRKGERAWVEAHPGPAAFGPDPGPPPSLRGAPRALRLVNEGLMWALDHVMAADGSSQRQRLSDGRITGIAASPGRYTGQVRVIHGEDEFAKLRSGDVVVCPVTSPVWSVLFPSMGALVTDTGGMLSHPAIIAREYHLPAVVATGNATDLLRDGERVTVDGSAGVVSLS